MSSLIWGALWGDEVDVRVDALRQNFTRESNPLRKKHYQVCALLLLKGAAHNPLSTEWYFNGLNQVEALRKVNQYADNPDFLPTLDPKIVSVYSSDRDFSESVLTNLRGFAQNQTLKGVSGTISVFEKSGQKITIKCSADQGHIKEEIIANALYAVLGVPIPKFFVVDKLPSLPAFRHIKDSFPRGPYLISEFIEGSRIPEVPQGIIKNHFLADAFLANNDAGLGLVIKGTVPYHTDNSGALRYESTGKKNESDDEDPWSSVLLPERINLALKEKKLYGTPSDDDLVAQAQCILEKSDLIFQKLQELYEVLQLSLKDQQKLDEMMLERLKILKMYAQKGSTFVAPVHLNVGQMTAAGAFILSKKPEGGEYHVLLGKRKIGKGKNTWCTLGGIADYGEDLDISHAAAREIYEESNGLINIPHTLFAHQTSHDLMRWNHRFRQYFIIHDFIDAALLNEHLQRAAAPSSREYHEFQWVPLSALIDKDALSRGAIHLEGQEPLTIFPAFLDLLKTKQAQLILNELKVDKLPTDVHTQSVPQDIILPFEDRAAMAEIDVGVKMFNLGRDVKRIKKSDENALAKTILHQRMVHDDIKRRRKIDNAAASSKSFGLNGPASKHNPYPFTQSEGHLSLYLGEDYVLTDANDEDKLAEIYGENLNRFFAKRPNAFQDVDVADINDDTFRKSTIQALIKERSMDPTFNVFYHATEGNIGYLYDIFTEFRQLLRGHFSDDVVIMRSVDAAFKDINTIEEFIAEFTVEGQFQGNYYKNYADLGLSLNPYLFGGPGGASTLMYFCQGMSIAPIDVRKFFDLLNTTLTGLGLDKGRYWRLFESIMGTNPEKDARLLQIFIRPDFVDKIVYASITKGYPISIAYDFLSGQIPLETFPENSNRMHAVLDVLKKSPTLFGETLLRSTAKGSGKLTPEATNADKLQARLLMKPEYVHDASIMKTYVYHRAPNITDQKIARLRTELRRFLAEDMARWMQAKVNHPQDTFSGESMIGSLETFKKKYHDAFGHEPTYEEEKLNHKLSRIYKNQDIASFEKLLSDHSLEELLRTEIIDDDSYRQSKVKKLSTSLNFIKKYATEITDKERVFALIRLSVKDQQEPDDAWGKFMDMVRALPNPEICMPAAAEGLADSIRTEPDLQKKFDAYRIKPLYFYSKDYNRIFDAAFGDAILAGGADFLEQLRSRNAYINTEAKFKERFPGLQAYIERQSRP